MGRSLKHRLEAGRMGLIPAGAGETFASVPANGVPRRRGDEPFRALPVISTNERASQASRFRRQRDRQMTGWRKSLQSVGDFAWLAVAPMRYSCFSLTKRLESAMPTTTIRLPENLKARVAEAGQRAGTTSRAFILATIAGKAEREERRADFDQVAEDRHARIAASGETIPWQEMRAFLEQHLAGNALATAPARRRRGPAITKSRN